MGSLVITRSKGVAAFSIATKLYLIQQDSVIDCTLLKISLQLYSYNLMSSTYWFSFLGGYLVILNLVYHNFYKNQDNIETDPIAFNGMCNKIDNLTT